MKKIVYSIFIFSHFLQGDVSLWDQVAVYTFTNKTSEIMEVSWQSGGGQESTLTGKRGTFTLAALKSMSVETSTRDCLDVVSVKGVTSAQTVSLQNVCKKEIAIRYQGEAKSQKLVLEVE
jgi:hypothetical protein